MTARFLESKTIRAVIDRAYSSGRNLYWFSRVVLVPFYDRIRTHVGKRLNGQRRVETAHRGERGAADDEQVRDIPALAVAIHDRGLWIVSHAGTTLMMRAWSRSEEHTSELQSHSF